jgi:hypothetical protein
VKAVSRPAVRAGAPRQRIFKGEFCHA